MKHDQNEELALSYPVNVRTLPVNGVTIKLDANEEERILLAKQHNVLLISSLEAELHIFPWKKKGIKIKGEIHSKLLQECVVTLEPLSNVIDETIEIVMVPEGSKLTKPKTYDETGEIFIEVEGPDLPEVYQGDIIDIGVVVEEFFELSLNPYPRKDGAEFIDFDINTSEKEDSRRPFEALKSLIDK